MGFLTSIFGGKKNEEPANEKETEKINQKNFEIFKYDGMRAARMGRIDFAIKCFTEALKISEEFETMHYLTQAYVQSGKLEEARQLLEQMCEKEPENLPTVLTLAQICYMLEDYDRMVEVAQNAVSLDENNAVCYYWLAKAVNGQGNSIMSIAHLTKAIVLKEDFTEARLMRAETLFKMQQLQEAMEDIESILKYDADEENALLLRGRISEAEGDIDAAQADFKQVTELNPFNEQAFLHMGRLLIGQNKNQEAIDVFNEAIEINPKFVQAYQERGRAKLALGDKEGSLEDVKKSLELSPNKIEDFNGTFNNQNQQESTNVLNI